MSMKEPSGMNTFAHISEIMGFKPRRVLYHFLSINDCICGMDGWLLRRYDKDGVDTVDIAFDFLFPGINSADFFIVKEGIPVREFFPTTSDFKPYPEYIKTEVFLAEVDHFLEIHDYLDDRKKGQ